MKKPISDRVVSDKPSPMQKPGDAPKIPTGDRGGVQNEMPSLKLRRTAIEGVVEWPRAYGVPDGPLDKAFGVACYIYTATFYDPLNPATLTKIKGPWSPVDVVEGPHDDQTFRITYRSYAQEIGGWGGDLAQFPEAKQNYVSVGIVAPWPANAATGPGTKSAEPAEAGFVHPMNGRIKGPTFRIVHVRQ
jgi:hypothetical protein